MSMRASNERYAEHAGQRQVVEILAAPREQERVLDAPDALGDVLSFRHLLTGRPAALCAGCGSHTIARTRSTASGNVVTCGRKGASASATAFANAPPAPDTPPSAPPLTPSKFRVDGVHSRIATRVSSGIS